MPWFQNMLLYSLVLTVNRVEAFARRAGLNNRDGALSMANHETSGTKDTVQAQQIFQVPVATICPQASNNRGNLSSLPSVSTLREPVLSGPHTNTSLTYNLGNVTNVTNVMSSHSDSASSLNSSVSMTFSNGSATETTLGRTGPFNNDTARILVGNDACQTIYVPVTKAICSATLTLAGLPTVRVTECEQWVTFSSATTHASVACAPPSLMSEDTLSVSWTASTETPNSNVLYYVAHWRDLATNIVPTIVHVEDCLGSRSGTDCSTRTESWEVSALTSTTVGVNLITWSGPITTVALEPTRLQPLQTQPMVTRSTISVSLLMTMTQTVTVPTILKYELPPNTTTTSSSSSSSSSSSEFVTQDLITPARNASTTSTAINIPATAATAAAAAAITVTKTWTLERVPTSMSMSTNTNTNTTTVTSTLTVTSTSTVLGTQTKTTTMTLTSGDGGDIVT